MITKEEFKKAQLIIEENSNKVRKIYNSKS